MVELRKIEMQYRELFENVPIGLYKTSLDGKFLDANPAMVELLGYPDRESLLATNAIKFYVNPEDRKRQQTLLKQEDVIRGFVMQLRRANGDVIWVRDMVRAIKDTDGNVLYNEGSLEDITTLKHAEEALKKSEHTYRALFEHANDAIFLLSLAGVHLAVNQQAADMLGYEKNELIGKAMRDIVSSHEYPDAENKREALLAGQSFPIYERIFRRKDGVEFPVEINASLVRDIEGKPLYIQSIVRDITQRKRAEQELRKVNRALKVLSECNQVLVRAEDEQGLLNDICQVIVEIGKYRFVWVGFTENDDAETVRPAAYAGFEQGYLNTVNVTWADSERGRGPAGTTIRTGEPAIVKNVLSDPDFVPLQSEAIRRGYSGIIGLLLLENSQPFGVLTIYTEETEAFDDEEVKLLEELAADLAYGILTLRTRAQHEQAEAKIHRQLQSLAALRAIDLAIISSLDLREIFDVLLDKLTAQLNLDAACVLLLNPHTHILEYAAGRGFRTQALQHTHLRLGEGYAGLAALKRRIINIPDLRNRKTDFLRSPFFSSEGFVAYYAVPLIAKGHVKGVMEVFQREQLNPDQEWLDFLEALAGQAAIALDNAGLFDDLQRSNVDLMLAYDTTIEGWSRALDLRDRETEGHSQRVTEMTLKLARKMGLSDAELVHVRRGALLHDIGKMGIPDYILLKPGALTDEEWEIMSKHPVFAYELLSPIAYLRPALDIPYCHHEKWDGTGYPRGLKGEQIPIAARIFSLADVWDALRSDRPYRQAWSVEKVLEFIQGQVGKHFDPKVVETFLRTVEDRVNERV